MTARVDIVRWIIERMRAHVPDFSPELALTIEREARAEWGGKRINYIAKLPRLTASRPTASLPSC